MGDLYRQEGRGTSGFAMRQHICITIEIHVVMDLIMIQGDCQKCDDLGDSHGTDCLVRKLLFNMDHHSQIKGSPSEAMEAAIRAFEKAIVRDKTLPMSCEIIPFESIPKGRRMSNLAETKKQEMVIQEPKVPQPSDMSNPFSSLANFESAQRMALALSKSSLIPKEYQNNVPNCLIALEISQRLRASALMVMQNLYVVHGKPGWSAQYIISAINSCGRFSQLRFKMDDQNTECTAYATELKTGELIIGTKVTLNMARAEGWIDKNGSKWKTMPEQMLKYRAASFFGKTNVPEILMGFQTAEEIEDMQPSPKTTKTVSSEVVVEQQSEPVITEEEPLVINNSVDETPIQDTELLEPGSDIDEEPARVVAPVKNSNELPWTKHLPKNGSASK